MTATCPCGAPAKTKFCSRACAGQSRMVGPPLGTVLGTCPCGADITRRGRQARDLDRKFCTRACAGRHGGGPPPPKATHCPRCGWAKDADNTYANGSCRRCTLANGRPDYVPLPRGVRPAAKTTKPRPRPVITPAPAPAEPAVPAWRPPGWAQVPNVKRVER